MARTLKTYQSSLGFFDVAIAAPSMKAALEAWGAGANLFHQGFARQTTDAAIVAATMAQPGVVLRRAVGSSGAFREDAALPTTLPVKRPAVPRKPAKTPKAAKAAKPAAPIERKAAAAFERERQKRERAQRKEEQAQERAQARRQRTINTAQAALDKASAHHDSQRAAFEVQLASIERRAKAEDTRWARQRAALEAALRRAKEA